MARFSEDTIREVKETADIIDVVSEYVKLQPAGKNHKGLCPFHQEKTPSFFVSKDRQTFKCFGCGEQGNAITFIQKIKNIPFPDAIRFLADKYNVSIEQGQGDGQSAHHENYYRINDKAATMYALNLLHTDKGKEALVYLKKRGLSVEDIKTFDLGYATDEFTALYDKLSTTYEAIDLLDLGLIKKSKNDGYYDLFRNRVMFPIKNAYGKTLGFSGRTLDRNQDAKYVNSPETVLFKKNGLLYNLSRAVPHIKRNKRVVLAEGFMDVIKIHKAGIEEVVCPMGTSLTRRQAALLKKNTQHIILCYDGDSAGIEAMRKITPILRKEGMDVSVAWLPDGNDPDDFIEEKSPQAFVDLINENTMDEAEFEYAYLKQGLDLSKPSAVERFKEHLFKTLIKHRSQVMADLFLRKMADDLEIEEKHIRQDYDDFCLLHQVRKRQVERKRKIIDMPVPKAGWRAEVRVLQYYCLDPHYRKRIDQEISAICFNDVLNREIQFVLEDESRFGRSLEPGKVAHQFSGEKAEKVERLLTPDKSDYNDEDLEQCLFTLMVGKIQNELRNVERKMKDMEKNTLNKAYMELITKKTRLRSQLDQMRKDVPWKKKK